jgi:hypothetical protein
MATSTTTGVRTPTLILTRVSEVQDALRAIPAAILGERQAMAWEVIRVDIHGVQHHQAFRVAAIRSGLHIQAYLPEVPPSGVVLHCGATDISF